MNRLLFWRASRLFKRLQAHLPAHGHILDVGSGTGHNSDLIETMTGLQVAKIDVTNMNIVGNPVTLYDGKHIPFPDHTFQAVLALFILHYIANPVSFLLELKRTGTGRFLVIQSVYTNSFGRVVLKLRDLLQGRGAFHVASALKLVPSGLCTMQPLHFYTRTELATLFEKTGFRIAEHTKAPWPGLGVSRDLYVLQPS